MAKSSSYISRGQTLKFLTEKLGFQNPETLMDQDKLGFLNALCRKFQNTVPFHNMAHMAVRPGERVIPSVDQNIAWVTAGEGGMCWTINSAVYCMLAALGYDVYPILASVHIRGTEDHIVILANGVKRPGDSYLVDLGFGSPMMEAVCLDFDAESDVYHQSFRVLKVVKEEDEYILKAYSRYRGESTEGQTWEVMYYFKKVPSDLQTISDAINKNIYTSDKTIFHKELRLNVFRADSMVAFVDCKLLVENAGHKLEETVLGVANGELLTTITQQFPTISAEMVEQAVRVWTECFYNKQLNK